jgi:hypothetical protein
VLATIYLVVLAIDAGWLTPERQLMLSMLGGFVCIGIGLMLRGRDMHDASLLVLGASLYLGMVVQKGWQAGGRLKMPMSRHRERSGTAPRSPR